jgi:plasmid stabilization system protein ParE
MRWTVRFTESAIEDVRGEIRFHKESEPRRDQEFLDTLRGAITHISDFPEAAPLAKAGSFKGGTRSEKSSLGPTAFSIFSETTSVGSSPSFTRRGTSPKPGSPALAPFRREKTNGLPDLLVVTARRPNKKTLRASKLGP